jgi:hypothetical protein
VGLGALPLGSLWTICDPPLFPAAIGLVIVRVESPRSGKVANPLATLPDPCPCPLPPLSRRSLPRVGGLAAAKLLLPLPRPSVALASCLSGAYGPS